MPADVPDPNVNAVNVIFHGLFLFVQQSPPGQTPYIDVLIPNMGTDHVYRAGAFLAEETLLPRPVNDPYFLANVTGGAAVFDPTANVVFPHQNYKTSAGPDEVYARIVLPVPAQIVSLRPAATPIIPDIDPGNLFTVQTPCGVQLLRYRARLDPLGNPDFADVALANHSAELVLNANSQCLNLHIFNEEDHNVPQEHAGYGFQKILQLLPNLSTPILVSKFTALSEEIVDHPEWGLAALETADLQERAKTMKQVGLDLRAHPGAAINLILPVSDPPNDCYPACSTFP